MASIIALKKMNDLLKNPDQFFKHILMICHLHIDKNENIRSIQKNLINSQLILNNKLTD